MIKSQPKGEKRAVHISAFSYGNAGDTLLPVVLRDLFNDTIGIKQWRSVDLHVEVRKSDVRFYNKKDFVVIGGGGLFLKCLILSKNTTDGKSLYFKAHSLKHFSLEAHSC